MTASTLTAPRRAGEVGSAVRGRLRPPHLLALTAAVLALLVATAPVLDVDAYWHVRVGHEIVSGRTLSGLGASWSFTDPDPRWTTSQWLSEVLMAAVQSASGWRGLSAARTLVGALVLLGLVRTVLRGAGAQARTLTYVVTALPLAYAFQERPQLLSLLLLVWLGGVARDLLAGAAGPSPALLLPLTWLWANLHGLWVMVPAVLLLTAVLRAVDGTQTLAGARRALLLAAGSVLAASLTPAGPGLLLAPLRISAAAHGHLQEWQPTTLLPVHTWSLSGLLVLAVAAWVRAPRRVPRSHLLYVLAWGAFGLTAYRNVPVATLLLAPVVADALATSYPDRGRPTSDREQARRGTAAAVLAGLGALAVCAQLLLVPALPSGWGIDHARRLASEPGPHRVLNAYDTGGVLLAFGGPRTQVAVDGRADAYGDAFLDEYADLMALRGAWRRSLARYERLGTTDAVLLRTTPLREELERRGWELVAQDQHYVLLERP